MGVTVRRASLVLGVLAFLATWAGGSAYSMGQSRGRVSGLYRVTFTPLTVHDAPYARVWAATPDCATGDCAFWVSARDAGARTAPARFTFRYDGDIYDYATHAVFACQMVRDANSKTPHKVTIAGGYLGTTDLKMRITRSTSAGRGTLLRGTFVVRETPSAAARKRGCTSTFVHRFRVTGRAES
jgi:hypothetical protein